MSEYTAPGVYVEELSWGRSVRPAETSVAALVGPAAAGPGDEAVRVHDVREARAVFGSGRSWLAQALADFFANGGRVALGVRAFADPVTALAAADAFQLMVCDPDTVDLPAAYDVAVRRRAFQLVDAVHGELPDGLGVNAAAYHPRLRDGRGALRGAAAAVAGVYARTDADHGVWKAPAGSRAVVHGATGLEATMRDSEIGALTIKRVNALRELHDDIVVWGARTAGEQGEWRYVAVRRLALFLEESLLGGLDWVVFEPNDERLWAAVRATVGAFLQDLWRLGAFQGTTAAQAYQVRCGADTMTRADLDQGLVVLMVGFAPLEPAEFVLLRLVLRTAAAQP